MTMETHTTSARRWVTIAMALASGCGEGMGAGGAGDATGRAVARITSVPTDVQCVRVTALGATQSFPVTAGMGTTLDLGPLAPGSMQVSAAAFNLACAAVEATSAPTWVGEPVNVVVTAGLTAEVAISLRPNARASASVDFVAPAERVACGEDTTYAVMRDGTLRAWGSNERGALGTGGFTGFNPNPARVMLPAPVRSVAGASGACAVTTDGRLYCWGKNDSGQIGDGSLTDRDTPTAVDLESDRVLQVAKAEFHTCALLDAHRGVRCWGANFFGTVGVGASTFYPNPQQPMLPTQAGQRPIGIAVGPYKSVAWLEGGVMLWWGTNFAGEFGVPASTTTFTTPSVLGLGGYDVVTSVAFGERHSCATTPLGELRCAGDDSFGQLGDGLTVPASGPTLASISQVVEVAASASTTCARVRSGAVWCWGRGDSGQLGDGRTTYGQPSPVRVHDLTDAVSVSVGRRHACAVRRDGSVWCWGNNALGQIGDGTNTTAFVPVRVRL
jgi:alpha-tubulin suppressor-like RCC1 family protein